MQENQPQSDREFRLHPGEDAPEAVFGRSNPPARELVRWEGNWNVDKLWKLGTGKGVRIGIADTGIEADHPAYAGRVKGMRDFTRSSSGAKDVNGHGTHCAGIAAGGLDSPAGPGVAVEADLYMAKVLGDSGSGSGSGIANGIDWLISQGIDVLSMSFGSDGEDPLVSAAVRRAHAKGIICVAAAGNAGPGQNTIGYPGNLPEVFCTAAVDSSLQVANFSSRGQQIDYAYLGVQVLSSYPGHRTATMSGTSMATPGLAGVIACLIESVAKKNVRWSRDIIDLTLEDAATLPNDRPSPTAIGRGIPVNWPAGPALPPPPPPPPGELWPPTLPVQVVFGGEGSQPLYLMRGDAALQVDKVK